MARPRWRCVTIVVGPVGLLSATLVTPANADPAPRSAVFVEFDRPSALQEYEQLGQGSAQAARAAIAQVTDDFLAHFRGSEGTAEIFRTSNAVAGVAVTATAATARALAARPGVRSVRRITPARTSNASADQLGRAVTAWQHTGRLGTGVRIGVIDTGIDYTHAAFGGPGTFPTAKVVGGIDLAGDDYDADASDPSRTIPTPDADPLDCEGHGSHVAGTAAGYGVTATGATFRGDYSRLTPAELDAMRIGPGSAPDASLYAIRVFGCSGSTALTAQGLDRALDPDGDGDFSDRLDVVNLSLGSSFSAADDPVNDFVRVLTEHGVLVVAAAGNDGDVYGAAGSPGNSPDALAVASVRDAGTLLDAVEGPAGPLAGQYSQTAGAAFDVTAPVVVPAGGNAQGCEKPAGVRGAIVWLEWPDDPERACGSAQRAGNALAAGAAGVLLTSTQSDFGSVRISGADGIPVFQLTVESTAALRPLLAAEPRVRLAAGLRRTQQVQVPGIADTVSAFTSRGSHAPVVKPDVAAPGESITSVKAGSGDDRVSESGTSMASPYVAGVAALVLEEHPEATPAKVKAAIMNTATADVFTGGNRRLAPMRVGAGRVDATAALATSVLAANADRPGAVSVTFGVVEVPPGSPLVRRQRVRVRNLGERPAALAVAYEAITRTPGVRIDVSPSRVSVAPGSAELLDVTPRIDDPAALRRTADPTLALEQEGQARAYLADASGRVTLTPADGPALRVPVSAAPRPVSALTATRSGGAVTLRGTAVDQGTGREAYRSRAGVFALAATSPRLPLCVSALAVSACVANGTGSGGDLRAVGLASTDTMLGVAVATWADLPSVGTSTVPEARFDTDGDGRADHATELTTVAGTDVLVARTVDLRVIPPRQVDLQPVNGFDGATDTRVFDTDAWVLPVRLTALGIDPAARSAPLAVEVVVHGKYGPPGAADGIVDATGPVTFDPLTAPARPALLVPADDGTRLPASATPLLVLLGQNPSGQRVTLLDTGA